MIDPAKNVRVCILTETYHPVTGGGETQARTLARELQRDGHSVCLVTRRSDSTLASTDVIDGVDVRRIRPAGAGQYRKWGMVVTALIELLRLRDRYDVILVCGFRLLGTPALLAGLLYGKSCILKADSQGELSGAFFDPGLARFRLRHDRFPVNFAVRLRNVLLRRAARFIAISAVIEREFARGGVTAGQVTRIPNSTDPEVFRPATITEKQALRSRLSLPRDRPIVVFTGRLVTTKGLPSLLRAWPQVLVAHPDALLLLVGSGGLGLQNCEDELRRDVDRRGLDHSVRFTGSVAEVHDYLRASDVFVFPSKREAFGISVIEAMSVAMPIVTTAIDGIDGIVRPEVDAIVVPPGDDKALARALVRALDGGETIFAMATSARKRAVELYSTDAIVAQYRRLLSEVSRS